VMTKCCCRWWWWWWWWWWCRCRRSALQASFVRWDRIRRQHRVGASSKAHAVSALSLSLGYATAQSLVFMLLVTEVFASNPEQDGEAQYIGAGEFGWMVFLSLFFAAVTMPLNLMGSYLTGIAIAKVRERGLSRVCISVRA